MIKDILLEMVLMVVELGLRLHEMEGALVHLFDGGEDSLVLEVVQHAFVLFDGVLVVTFDC